LGVVDRNAKSVVIAFGEGDEALRREIVGSQSGDPQVINVSLNGAGGFQDPAFIGTGTTQESLSAAQSPGIGTLSGDSLSGQLTYNYTPAPVPEPSTWAMMLIAFAGFGYALARRKPARRSIQA
jgi:PEP-CTERM motif-containing protein